jgi:hypothetical protein
MFFSVLREGKTGVSGRCKHRLTFLVIFSPPRAIARGIGSECWQGLLDLIAVLERG